MGVRCDTGAALDSLAELVRRGDGRISLTDTIAFARSLGQVGPDEWEYAAVEEVLLPKLWLELKGGVPERAERVRLAAHEFTLLDARGWRDDWADPLAELRVWVATFLAGLARMFRLDGEDLAEVDLTSADSRKKVARRAGELRRCRLEANDARAGR